MPRFGNRRKQNFLIAEISFLDRGGKGSDFSRTMAMRDTEFLEKPTNRTDAAAQLREEPREEVRSSSAWRRIQEEFLATGRAAPLHRAWTQTVDAVVVEAFQASIAPVLPQAAL